VLTAFAPINHLKLMEQRLELWAKVFEASSEGILIIDSELRVLTANQAFYRGTGYDHHDVIGQHPVFLSGLPAPRNAEGGIEPGHGTLQDLAQTVSRRGAWQGEAKILKRNGDAYPAWLMASAVRERDDHVSYYILTSIDISDRKRSEARIEFLAQHDVLTELPNRALCTERLRLALQSAQRSKQKVAVLFIDLDRFKNINDSLGHHIGDGLLRSVAARLTQSVRAVDTVSRLGGDEFIVVLNGVADVDEISHVVDQRLIPLIRQPHTIEGAEIHVSCSIGIAVFPEDGQDIDVLMQHADAAMYEAKAGGRNDSRFFSAEMTERSRARLHLESSLRHAIELGQLTLVYQPSVKAQTGELAGFEGLLRWNHPELGAISPLQFIPIAEEAGLIVPIGAWVIEQACAQMASWRDTGHPRMQVSINLSAVQLKHPGLLEALRDSMARHGIGAGLLELEITESTLMESVEANLKKLSAIRALGVRLSIDDFGTGYSSLNYLNRFPLDRLKIDRSFVHDMVDGSTDLAIAKAIIGLGHTLGLMVVAEGVETEMEVRLLRAAGCDEFQGFFFARPRLPQDLGAWLDDPAVVVSATLRVV
jgi:diguanylate cyclase (GGDEF)-like protein/PAS domain S-box-containing protein